MLTRTFFQAFGLVTCVAANTSFIAQGRYDRAFIAGFCISYIWWWNARTAARDGSKLAHFIYSFGAACGTVTGMYIAHVK